MIHWDTSCLDWESRIENGVSLVPFEPLFPDEAQAALDVFKGLKIVDLPGHPTFGDCCEEWVFDFVAAIFGAYDAKTGKRLIREFFLLISKKNSKSTLAAGIMITALIRNWRHSSELLVLAPTIEVADNCFKPARDMVENDESLKTMLKVQDHTRTIKHLTNSSVLKVVAADTDTVSGKKAAFVLVDELWVFGKRRHADAMLSEATGGQVSRDEGFVIYLSTHSDEIPAGVFKSKLSYFRRVRDGEIHDPQALPVLYEFPNRYHENEAYLDPNNWFMTNPNMGRSVSREWLERKYKQVTLGEDDELDAQLFLAKHLNVEIGISKSRDRWAGVDFWLPQADPQMASFKNMLEVCEVITAGVDGGGLFDLLGLAFCGRHRDTKQWLFTFRAWAQDTVFERNKAEVSKLNSFVKEGYLTKCSDPRQDVEEVAEMIETVYDAGLFPKEYGIGLDAVGVSAITDEIALRDVPPELMCAVTQGYQLSGNIKGFARKLKDGTILHDGSEFMVWSVGNCRSEKRGNAELITKQLSGSAKIDPMIAGFNAFSLMSRNPEAASHISVYAERGAIVI